MVLLLLVVVDCTLLLGGKTVRVLIVEDEPDIRRLLRAYLENEGFAVDETNNGQRALTMASENTYDLVILDIMIPEIDGWSVCQKIRKHSTVPIIMVTAKGTEPNRIMGLELGADDYLVKPFSPKELIARIKALFRRIKAAAPAPVKAENINVGSLVINPDSHQAKVNGSVLPLTPKEFSILYCLARNPDKAFTRNELLLEVWGDQFTDTRTVDAHIKQIREKLANAGLNKDIISTVWGVGYKFGDVSDV